jgi:hypothetical protein
LSQFKAIEENLTGKYLITDGTTVLHMAMVVEGGSATCPVVFSAKAFAEKFLQEYLSDKPDDLWAQSAMIVRVESCAGIKKASLYVDIGKVFDGFTIEDCDGACSDCDFYAECGGELVQQ